MKRTKYAWRRQRIQTAYNAPCNILDSIEVCFDERHSSTKFRDSGVVDVLSIRWLIEDVVSLAECRQSLFIVTVIIHLHLHRHMQLTPRRWWRRCLVDSKLCDQGCTWWDHKLRNAEISYLKPLDSKAIIMLHRLIWSWYTGRRWVGCYIWYSKEEPGWAVAPPSPLLALPNLTAQCCNNRLLYNGLLLCCFNVAIKGLMALINASPHGGIKHCVCLSVQSC